jgi:hypothetical protein
LFEAFIQDDKDDGREDWRFQPKVCTAAAVCSVPSRPASW